MNRHLAQVQAWLDEAAASLRMLQTLSWSASVRQAFFDRGAAALPPVAPPAFDDGPVRTLVERARKHLGHAHGPLEQWLARRADAIEAGALMLAAAGTPAFVTHSRHLFGAPDDPSGPGAAASRLAHRIDRAAASLSADAVGPGPTADYDAGALAAHLRDAVAQAFGAAAPEVVVVDGLAANVLAGPDTVRVRARARFSERDLAQLIVHEVYLHVLTTHNGRAQTQLPLLARALPGTTATQEGLAVFAEHTTGRLSFERLQRLAHRVLAIEHALDGADFVEVYRFFVERTGDADEAFDNTQRIFRGGRVDGQIVFTKDVVYLAGLVRVHAFLQEAIAASRLDLLPLLLVGKLALEDIDLLAQLAAEGVVDPPVHMPPWATDRRVLAAQLTYAGFWQDEAGAEMVALDRQALADAPSLAGFAR